MMTRKCNKEINMNEVKLVSSGVFLKLDLNKPSKTEKFITPDEMNGRTLYDLAKENIFIRIPDKKECKACC